MGHDNEGSQKIKFKTKLVKKKKKRFNTELPCDQIIPYLGTYTKELKAKTHTHIRMPINVQISLIHNSQKVETTQCPSMDE